MPVLLRTILSILFIGLLGLHSVHGIDGDLGNPYADGMAQTTRQPAIYDGTLDYGGKFQEIPIITMAGSIILVFGIVVAGFILIKEKKQKSQV
jgi:hypothetical protein